MACSPKTDILNSHAFILEACNNDPDVVLFFSKWLELNRNGTEAYLSLHPNATRDSAGVLASRILGKVRKDLLLEAYGLNTNKYMTQLDAGLQAEKRDQFSGEMSPDHKTRREYHKVLGQFLGIEKESGASATIGIKDGDKEIVVRIEEYK